ncbi:MAG: c-type cytochrome, partial [Planctomycetaceae bacterium]|nr:c-type cytochrome [Planctomycetaceae bacterium]
EDLLLVDDTANLDHAGIIRALGDKDLSAGKRIFSEQCQVCHGADGNTPKLAAARAFGTQPLKYGADPYKMLLTLTRGAGLMTPMQHLSPQERYQVIYYIREALMKPSNSAYVAVDEAYLKSLPQGTGRGIHVVSTADRDFGPVLGSQIGSQVPNALTFRLPDNIAVGYDLHRMHTVGVWTGGFLDLAETHHYRQRGERMPQIPGEMIPGLSEWGWALGGSFDLPSAAKPPRGSVREDWLRYRGHYLHGDRAVLSFAVHGRAILETVRGSRTGGRALLRHTLRIDSGDRPLQLSVARLNIDTGSAGLLAAGESNLKGRSGPAGEHIAVVLGDSFAASQKPMMADRPWHVVTHDEARRLDLGAAGRTVVVRFRADRDGTLIASAPSSGRWKPNGKTLFIRGGRLVYDIGWVGAIVGKSRIDDGRWHTAALVVTEAATKVYVDGALEAERAHFRANPELGHVLKIGATATDFGGDYDGELAWVRIYDAEFSAERLAQLADASHPSEQKAIFSWEPQPQDSNSSSSARRRRPPPAVAAAAVTGDTAGTTWRIDDVGRIILSIPADDRPRVLEIVRSSDTGDSWLEICEAVRSAAKNRPIDPLTMTRGGPERWPQLLEVRGTHGEMINGYALDTIPVPFKNPWNAWLRTSALDFFDDGRAVVTTHGGDVYIVGGLDLSLRRVTWKRFAAGLFEPFGVRVVDGKIYVTCRDGIKRLHDFNGDDEADFVEAFWNDDDVSCSFHAYNFDLQTDSAGNFYLAKSGQYTQHHRPGSIMRIPPEGGRAEAIAWGLRTPNGMGKLPGDRFTVSDNQGPWMPAGKISLIKLGGFYGSMPINQDQKKWLQLRHDGSVPDDFEPPIIWLPQELDNSSGAQVWDEDARFGPLSGHLIHSSFGKGRLYYLSLQDVGEKTQASIVALPHQWEAGVMRLRANPADGQLYGTGLSGWQGPRDGKDGCLQRLRYGGDEAKIIDHVRVTSTGLELRFNFAVDPGSAGDPQSWRGEMWNYLWSQQYGSDQYSVTRSGVKGRDTLAIREIHLLDERTLRLIIPNLRVCDQLSLTMEFKDAQGWGFVEQVYLTVHEMPASERVRR